MSSDNHMATISKHWGKGLLIELEFMLLQLQCKKPRWWSVMDQSVHPAELFDLEMVKCKCQWAHKIKWSSGNPDSSHKIKWTKLYGYRMQCFIHVLLLGKLSINPQDSTWFNNGGFLFAFFIFSHLIFFLPWFQLFFLLWLAVQTRDQHHLSLLQPVQTPQSNKIKNKGRRQRCADTGAPTWIYTVCMIFFKCSSPS